MRFRRKTTEEAPDGFIDAITQAAEAQGRIAAAQEATNNQRPDLRIHAIAYAVQSFSGREASNSDILIRAEAFFLFLTDQREATK